ncbi:MAG: aminotransferase class I/II-fold pyridoxal phosphate-dependent enzyme [Selenomonadaceae bacterium]|nr:aminotransferase class I/II-fold pyridoxal phosphate-dependent enzyme [Selenomonadaceae bacterium]
MQEIFFTSLKSPDYFFGGIILNKKFSAPLVEAMKKYSADGAFAFHTPGHKQGLGAHELLKNLITSEGLRQEVSLMEELDDLHSPHSCIKSAEILAAELFHADEVFFMINGTTSAVQAMILSTLKEGDFVFVPRNSHRSVMAGIILAGAIPIFLPIEFSKELKIPLNLKIETLQQAIKNFPQAKALILTSPNYYGVAADLKKISEILHENKMLLLVDEAHGAHLNFCEQLPISAMDAGADLSAQSTHKILGSLTQTSMLLAKKDFIDLEKVRRAASLLQSTSPNYLLLASLDIARLQMAESGREKILSAVELSKKLRAEINLIDGLKTFYKVKNFSLDLTKVTVNTENLNLTGLEAEKILRHELKIQCELSDAENLLFLITYADNKEKISKLVNALKKLSSYKKKSPLPTFKNYFSEKISVAEVSPREIFFSNCENIPLEKSVGKICAEEITFYPPGIPILNPGEIITAEILDYIRENKKIGRRIIGASDVEMNTIKICFITPTKINGKMKI